MHGIHIHKGYSPWWTFSTRSLFDVWAFSFKNLRIVLTVSKNVLYARRPSRQDPLPSTRKMSRHRPTSQRSRRCRRAYLDRRRAPSKDAPFERVSKCFGRRFKFGVAKHGVDRGQEWNWPRVDREEDGIDRRQEWNWPRGSSVGGVLHGECKVLSIEFRQRRVVQKSFKAYIYMDMEI